MQGLRRCTLSALAGLQLDHASLVLKAMAHDPMQLHSSTLAHTTLQASASSAAATPHEDAAGLAAAVMVLERVLMVRLRIQVTVCSAETVQRRSIAHTETTNFKMFSMLQKLPRNCLSRSQLVV